MPQLDAPGSPGKALVVDDDATNRVFIRALLIKEGYDVILAEDGIEGVARFREVRPDIVFMDVMMPHMDGYEAARLIKELAGETFVPVIFLTALSDDEAMMSCINAGGDDFLSKPFKKNTLKSKIIAMQRIRDLYKRFDEQRRELRVLQALRLHDDEIAQQVFARALSGNHGALSRVRHLLRPATTFNGDLLLAARRPGGGMNLMIGDFTGHGLAAAVGTLPVSDIFQAMTAKGFSASDIIGRINAKLRTVLPVEMFLSACFVSLEKDFQVAEIWNGGMPNVLVVGHDTRRVRQHVASHHLPLGIVAFGAADLSMERVPVGPDDRLILCSDGLIEARNSQGVEFGDAGLISAIEHMSGGDEAFTRIVQALDIFCDKVSQDDDISLVEVPCSIDALDTQSLQPVHFKTAGDGCTGNVAWHWSIELRATSLKTVDPVPVAINLCQELSGKNFPHSLLFTILHELYTNALDHGVLEIDSSLKNSGAGFERYYRSREDRLASIDEGYVRIYLEFLPAGAVRRLRIIVEDSGAGFAWRSILNDTGNAGDLCGRGIRLVSSLCESLSYEGCGNRAEAVYVWNG